METVVVKAIKIVGGTPGGELYRHTLSTIECKCTHTLIANANENDKSFPIDNGELQQMF